MNDRQYDVTAIGNAIVDVLAQAEDAFLEEHKLPKGAMSLIDALDAERLYDIMGVGVERSGGSAANTAAGLAGLGAKVGFIGKVSDDQLGEVFRHDIKAVGVDFETLPLTEGLSTARCLIFVTPDAQRTMQTFLGACTAFSAADVDEDMIKNSKVLYMEGYLWDAPHAIDGLLKAIDVAKAAGTKVSFTLSDAFCVDRFRDQFIELIENHVDILFANENEILSLFQVESFDDALQHIRHKCEVAALTRSEKGSVVISGDEVHVIDAKKVKVVDTTGAGDAYAAGFLYGYTHGRPLDVCGHMGVVMASEVISHYGARAEADPKQLIAGI
jgi:sugar/nucleoside kinase (ribokinase family)